MSVRTLLDGREALRVGRPEDDDLVEAVLLLEGADVAPYCLHLLLLAPLQHVVGTGGLGDPKGGG